MTLNYDIAVDLTPEFNRQLSPKFSVSLGDHGAREYTVQILQDGEPFVIEEGSTVSIVGKKSDGHIFAYACTYFDSFVRFTIEEQMTPVSGIVTCELSIIDASGNKVGSANFTYWVEPSPVTDGEASESDLQLFQQLLDAADDLDDVREILDRAVPIAEQLGDVEKLLTAFPTEEASGSLLAITDGADGIPAKKLTLNLQPHMSGNGDPSPENVRPISGYESVKVTRAEKNLLTISVRTVTTNGVTFEAKADGTVHVYGTATDQANFTVGTTEELPEDLYRFGGIPVGASNQTYFMTRNIGTGNMFVDGDYTVFGALAPRIYVRSGVSCDVVFKPFVGLASEAQTYTIAIPTAAGTVYGGQLTVNDDGSGTLVVDTGYLKVTAASDFAEIGSFNEGTNGNRCGFRVKNNPFVSGADLCCNIGKPDSSASGSTAYFIVNTCWLYGPASGSYFRYIFPKTVTDSAAAIQYLIDNGCEFTYKLKEPTTYTLTAEQVTTLLGDNTLWMDADGSIDLTYRADTQMYIDSRIALLNSNLAYIEDGTTASRAYTVGQYVLIGGQLYKVTASIASGATFTVGTNVVATTVGAELTALN